MKRLGRILALMIMVGILALPGFASQEPSPAPATAAQQVAATANAYGEKIFVGKIEYTSSLGLHIPPGRTLRLSSDKGDKLTIFVSNDIAIRDMNAAPTRIGEKAEVKYSSAANGENEVISFRYVPLDYVQQSIAPVIPADKAVVYIYRPSGSGAGGVAMPFDVKVSGKTVTTLTQGGYYAYVTEPGQIEFATFETGFMAPTSTSSIAVDAKAGQAYYLKGAHGKGMAGRAKLVSVSPEVGASEIANCKVIAMQ